MNTHTVHPATAQEIFHPLEAYIEALRAEDVAHLPTPVTSEQRRIYRMAAFFCSLSRCPVEPSAAFAEALYARLLTIKQDADHLPAGSRSTFPLR